jgi:F-type H+-transporting ATPase subunit epsilon
VTILATTAERAHEIDLERARAAKERAEQRLKERQEGIDFAKAEIALQRAIARIRAAERAVI